MQTTLKGGCLCAQALWHQAHSIGTRLVLLYATVTTPVSLSVCNRRPQGCGAGPSAAYAAGHHARATAVLAQGPGECACRQGVLPLLQVRFAASNMAWLIRLHAVLQSACKMLCSVLHAWRALMLLVLVAQAAPVPLIAYLKLVCRAAHAALACAARAC